MGYRISFSGIMLTYKFVFFRNRTYVKLLDVQNVTPTPVPCENTSRQFMGLISMRINDIRVMEMVTTAVVEEVEVAETDLVPMTRHRIGAMRCR